MKTVNLNRKARTVAEVNKAIQQKFPNVILVRGTGYYYISSDDEETALKIAGFYATSIPVAYLHQQTIAQWVKDVEELMKGDEYSGSTGTPTMITQ